MKCYAVTFLPPDRIDLFVYSDIWIWHYSYSIKNNIWNGTTSKSGNEGLPHGGLRSDIVAVSSQQSIIDSQPTKPSIPVPVSRQHALKPEAAHVAEMVSTHIEAPPPQAGTQYVMSLFGVGPDWAMYTMQLEESTTSAQQQWSSLGGSFISSPGAVSWGNRIDVFGLGTDRAMYQRSHVKGWSAAWVRLGGTFSSAPCAVSWGSGRLDVFARGADFTLRHRTTLDGTNWVTDWQNLGGSLATQPVAVSWGPNRLDVFAVDNTGALVHAWWDGQIWNAWETVGFPGTPDQKLTYVDTPSVVTRGVEHIDVLTLGSDGFCYHMWLDQGSWHGTELVIDSTKATSPASSYATGIGANTMFVVRPDNKGRTLVNTYNGTWGSWVSGSGTNFNFAKPTLLNRYSFRLVDFLAKTTRSLVNDTDTVAATLAIGNWPMRTATQSLGDVGATTHTGAGINMVFSPVLAELCEGAVFNYQIVNTTDATISDPLATAGKSLASQAVSSIKTAINQGLAALGGITVGALTGVPVLGSILGLVEGWLVDQIEGVVFAKCDGLVAVEQIVAFGKDLEIKTVVGVEGWEVTTVHNGTDSNAGCGSNSIYEVTWQIKQV